jgi:centrosomal protein CEP104
VRPDPREFEQAVGQGLSPSQLAKIRDNAGPDDVPPVGNEYQAALKSNWAYDDRPAVSKAAAAETAFAGTPQRFRDDGGPLSHNFDPSSVGGNNDEVVARATGAPRVPSGMDEEFPGDSKTNGDGASRFGPGDVPAGFNADLPPPEPISSSLAAEASPVIEAFGEYAAACLYSKNWMHREAALHKMESDVARGGVKTDREVFRAVCQCLSRLFKDKVANVFASSCRLLATATRVMGPGVGAREVHSNTANLVPQLLEKLGDAHAKARDAAREALMELAESELSLVAVALVRPVRSQSAWRIVLGRLSIMLDLVPRFGLAKAGDHGLTLEAVMEFTARTFESPNGEVRSTAVKLTLECCAIAGRAVEKFLPKNLKPAIRDVIDEGLGIKTGMDRGRDDDGTVTAANARGGGRAQGGVEPRRAPATPPGARGGGPGGSGYGGSLNAPPGAPPTARELKAEIAERELELGKNHPDVAVALTDLAALYSEEENFADARPLYERALRIQEKTLGAEHQDTTQTLTDLAICHLDQGNNDVGRPLLERALVLQERALGPDHADVTAIRDVLQSLDAEDA